MLVGSKLPRFPLFVALTATAAWGGVARAQPPTVAPSQAAAPVPQSDPQAPTPQLQATPQSQAPSKRGDSLLPPPSGGNGPSATPAPSPSGGGSSSTSGPQVNASISPFHDQQSLVNQGDQRPPGESSGDIGAKPSDVYSEDWWGHTRPILELHGYFRTRGELFHNFSLGRHDSATSPNNPNLWPQPIDNSYTSLPSNANNVLLCGGLDAQGNPGLCNDKSQASANMRFRMNPELHISDNLRIVSQIDALNNVVLGSTPESYAITPSKTGGYTSAGYNGYAPLGFYSTTQGPPTAGVNGYTNSINVNRVWAEYMTPVGQIRFGRMPDQWGLGMVHNAGDGIDSDYQSTIDRIMFVSGIRSMDLYFGGSWDFISTGPTSATAFSVNGGQPYDTCQLCNVAQYSLFVAHRTNPELQRLQLARGNLVVNGGLYGSYRSQWIDVAESNGSTAPQTLDTTVTNNGLEARRAWAVTPDLWVQLLWRKLRIEGEFASSWGEIGKTQAYTGLGNPSDIRQFGFATQTEYRAVEDKLHLQFGAGWASGDPWASSLNPSSTTTTSSGLRSEADGGRGPIQTFAFHPDYRVDLIFFRNILSRVEGAYYFRPSVDYDFLRHADGQKFGGGAAIIWSRASEFMQTPGHKRDLGVEMDLQIYYQAKDGSLNDNPEKLGGFFAMIQYGVFFPLGGLSYQSGIVSANSSVNLDTSAAQTVRLFLGVAY
jgi:uncharacterized protein (TIGR04551 family)